MTFRGITMTGECLLMKNSLTFKLIKRLAKSFFYYSLKAFYVCLNSDLTDCTVPGTCVLIWARVFSGCTRTRHASPRPLLPRCRELWSRPSVRVWAWAEAAAVGPRAASPPRAASAPPAPVRAFSCYIIHFTLPSLFLRVPMQFGFYLRNIQVWISMEKHLCFQTIASI